MQCVLAMPCPAAADDPEYEVQADGGYLFQPSLGWRFGAAAKANFTFDLGLKWQKASWQKVAKLNGDQETRDMLYQRFNMRFGLVF